MAPGLGLKTRLLIILLAWGLMGCRFLVNTVAFLPDRRDIIPVERLPDGVREIFITTDDRLRLQCYWLRHPRSDRLLIYFHGNAGNIGHRLPDLRVLAGMGLHVLGVGYRGYGKSTGKPSEQGLYTDGRAALTYATNTLGFTGDRIIVFGRSIGTTVAVDLAKNTTFAGVILVSPMTSGKAVAKSKGLGLLAWAAGDAFNNIDKIEKITSPLLIVHGAEDEVIALDMGRQLLAKAPPPKRIAVIKGAGHNDIGTLWAGPYWSSVKTFIDGLPPPIQ